MDVNYNELSKKYDNVRAADGDLITVFLEKVNLGEEARVLDFGCGTGNYAGKLHSMTNARVYGVEPSAGMREKAIAKNKNVIFAAGDHANIPFPSGFFDFIYMTDVIHHVPVLDILFTELKRVLKTSGKLCIVTQSHRQIERRFYVKYFPATAIVDKKRYPDIDEIIASGEKNGLNYINTIIASEGKNMKVGNTFHQLVREKGYSMFHLIPEVEYEAGLKQLSNDLLLGDLMCKAAGQTLVWFEKKEFTGGCYMSYRIAIASLDGKFVNEHFGRAKEFHIVEVNENKYKYIETRKNVPSKSYDERHDYAMSEAI